MPLTPALNGQVIGQAHHATRALLGPVLDRTGTTFQQSLVLNALADGEAVDRTELLGRVAGALKVAESEASEAVDELATAGLLEPLNGDGSQVRITDPGRARNHEIRSAIAVITERLYGDIPAEDLATAGRVLSLVTARANAELATVR